MKFLLILGIALLVVWLWRHNRGSERADAEHAAPAAPARPRQNESLSNTAPTEIVACAFCDVHLPRHEAVAHGGRLYCSDAHRRQSEAG